MRIVAALFTRGPRQAEWGEAVHLFPQKQSCPSVTVSTEKLVFSVFLGDHFLSQNESWSNDLINSTYFHVGDDEHNSCQLRDVIWQQYTRDHDLQIMLLLWISEKTMVINEGLGIRPKCHL